MPEYTVTATLNLEVAVEAKNEDDAEKLVDTKCSLDVGPNMYKPHKYGSIIDVDEDLQIDDVVED